MRLTLRLVFPLIVLLSAAGCPSGTGKDRTPELPEGWGEVDESACRVIRSITLGSAGEEIWLLDICPDDDRIRELDYAINIAAEGEPTVTTYIDTLLRFESKRDARAFAEEHDILDIVL